MRSVFQMLCALVLMTTGVTSVHTQRYLDMQARADQFTFQEIVDEFNAYAKEAGGVTNVPGYKQFRRWEMDQQFRLSEDGKVTNAAMRSARAIKSLEEMTADQRAYAGLWDELGPVDYTFGADGSAQSGGNGRINCIAFHPTNANTLYIGACVGGLWKSVDAGMTWSGLTDGLPAIGVSGIAINPTNANIMYILTGDGDGMANYSIGVLKSLDGGVSWQQTAHIWSSNDLVRPYKLLMHPTNPQILFIVSSDGIHKTVNGGISWVRKQVGNFTDIEFRPGNPAVMYAVSKPEAFVDGKFFTSIDAGENWTQYSGAQLPEDDFNRMAVAVTSDDPTRIYLLVAGGLTGYKGLYMSSDTGLTWTQQSGSPNIMSGTQNGSDTIHQAGYDIALTVLPGNPDHIYVGGINVWESLNAGQTWAPITQQYPENNPVGYVHADIHSLTFHNGKFYCTSDGGVFVSPDDGANWTRISAGLGITQFYFIDVEDNLIIGGTQDNGTFVWPTSTMTAEKLFGGDGLKCFFDYSDPDIWYLSTQGDRLKSTGGSAGPISNIDTNPDTINDIWQGGWIQDPFNPLRLYMAEYDVYRSTDGGATWQLILDQTNEGHRTEGLIQGVNNPNYLYASNLNTLKRSASAASPTVTWTDITPPGVVSISKKITDIALDTDDATRLWVSVSGYFDGIKVFYSDDAGATWTNVSAGLPNVPVLRILFDNTSTDRLYAGTDIGVFTLDLENVNAQWRPFVNGLPRVQIQDLVVSDGYLYAATYGRGVWRSTLAYPCAESALILTTADLPAQGANLGTYIFSAIDIIVSSMVVESNVGTDVRYQAGNYVRMDPGFQIKAGSEYQARIGPCDD